MARDEDFTLADMHELDNAAYRNAARLRHLADSLDTNGTATLCQDDLKLFDKLFARHKVPQPKTVKTISKPNTPTTWA